MCRCLSPTGCHPHSYHSLGIISHTLHRPLGSRHTYSTRKKLRNQQRQKNNFPRDEEEEDDDDPVIVYKEAIANERSWGLSQLSVTSTRHQSTKQQQQQQQQQEGEREEEKHHEESGNSTSNLVSIKGRRNKFRRRRRRRRQLTEYEPTDDDREDDDSSGSDEVDAFASLRSMMVQLSQEQKNIVDVEHRQGHGEQIETETANGNNHAKCSPCDPIKNTSLPNRNRNNPILQDSSDGKTILFKNRIGEESSSPLEAEGTKKSTKQLRETSVDCNKVCSPPDFDICVSYHNYDDDYNSDNDNGGQDDAESIPSLLPFRDQNSALTGKNSNKKISGNSKMNQNSNKSSGQTSNKKGLGPIRSRSRNVDTVSSKKRLRQELTVSSSSSSAVTTAIHRRKSTDNSSSKRIFATHPSENKNHSHQLAASIDVESVKSIVGLRYVQYCDAAVTCCIMTDMVLLRTCTTYYYNHIW